MFNFFKILISYLPIVIRVVKEVENIYKEQDGQKKKEIAISFLLQIIKVPEEKQKDIKNLLSGLIDVVVAIFNLTGIFK